MVIGFHLKLDLHIIEARLVVVVVIRYVCVYDEHPLAGQDIQYTFFDNYYINLLQYYSMYGRKTN